MTDEEIQAMQRQVAELTEKLRVALILNEQLNAQIGEMRDRERGFSEKDRWWGYKSQDGNLRGSFDMLMVSGWRSNLLTRRGWQTVVCAGNYMHDLDDGMSKEFWAKFDGYLKRT